MTAVTLIGASGKQYTYTAYEFSTTKWNDVSGGYAFAYIAQNQKWTILYIGQADSFSGRLPSHERWAEAARNGATHVLARLNQDGEKSRLAEEKDLIATYDPPLNIQHRLQVQTQEQVGKFGQKK